MQGVIAEVQFANPHAYIFIEDVDANRTRVRWAVDNSGTLALTRQRFDEQRDRVLTGRLLVLKSVPAEHWWHYGPLEAFQALLERHR